MEKLRGKGIIRYLFPVLVTTVIYSIILFSKGIFPFGKDTIDYYDMAQQIAAFYYHVYDMLHGSKAFFYDFYTALGTNMVMSTSGCSNISIFNLFFLFIKRSCLLESLSVFHGIKLMVMTLTMYIYVHKSYKLPYYFETMISVGYAFCGFVLLLYITNQWMDIAAFFPLLMLYYDRLMKEGKIGGYVTLLTVITVNSYYLSFMILLFLLLYTGFIIAREKIYVSPENRQRIYIMELFAGTVFALVLSSVIMIPQLSQTLSSARFSNENTGGLLSQYKAIISQVTPAYTTRWWSLLNASLPLAVIFVGFFKARGGRKRSFMTLSLLFVMLLELFLESVNLIWHFGSYVQYPIRNGFIIYFVLAMLCCTYAEDLVKSEFERVSLVGLVIPVILFILFVYLYSNHRGILLRTAFHITGLMMLISFIIYVLLLFWKSARHFSLAIIILCTELLCFGHFMYGRPGYVSGYSEEPEQEGEYIRICEQLMENFDLEDEVFHRIKNPDESLNANYGLVLRRAALSNWTHLVPKATQEDAAKWGYSIQFTRILDAGGTAFTDALIGVKDIISFKELDEELYEKVDSCKLVVDHLTGEEKTFYHYKTRYKLPFIIPLYSNAIFNSEMESKDMVNYQNQIFRAMTGADTEEELSIASWIVRSGQLVDESSGISFQEIKGEGGMPDVKRTSVNVNVVGKKALYYTGNCYDTEDKNVTITCYDKDETRVIEIPSIKEPDNYLYPAHFNNNAVYLGSFENENVMITVDCTVSEELKEKPVFISELDLNKLKLLCEGYEEKEGSVIAGKRSLDFSIEVDEANGSAVAILPLAYDDGWEFKINDKKSNIAYSYNGLFTAIPLYSGTNRISMSFVPKGMGIGAVLSFGGLILLVLYGALKNSKSKFIRDEFNLLSKDVENWLTPLYMFGFFILLCIMYFIPIVYGIYSIIAK
ncbi:MAG: YfhO family protein [Lachnospiraceae bacterium]|nr:YfhO family protein [Lachnospiraceae bacterium]